MKELAQKLRQAIDKKQQYQRQDPKKLLEKLYSLDAEKDNCLDYDETEIENYFSDWLHRGIDAARRYVIQYADQYPKKYEQLESIFFARLNNQPQPSRVTQPEENIDDLVQEIVKQLKSRLIEAKENPQDLEKAVFDICSSGYIDDVLTDTDTYDKFVKTIALVEIKSQFIESICDNLKKSKRLNSIVRKLFLLAAIAPQQASSDEIKFTKANVIKILTLLFPKAITTTNKKQIPQELKLLTQPFPTTDKNVFALRYLLASLKEDINELSNLAINEDSEQFATMFTEEINQLNQFSQNNFMQRRSFYDNLLAVLSNTEYPLYKVILPNINKLLPLNSLKENIKAPIDETAFDLHSLSWNFFKPKRKEPVFSHESILAKKILEILSYQDAWLKEGKSAKNLPETIKLMIGAIAGKDTKEINSILEKNGNKFPEADLEMAIGWTLQESNAQLIELWNRFDQIATAKKSEWAIGRSELTTSLLDAIINKDAKKTDEILTTMKNKHEILTKGKSNSSELKI